MKNILAKVAIAACLISTGANANPVVNATSKLTVTTASALTPLLHTSSFANDTMIKDGFSTELSFVYGQLQASGAGTVTYTYLGSSAGYTDSFLATNGSSFWNRTSGTNSATVLGSSFTQNINSAGTLGFSFSTLTPSYTVSDAQNIQSSSYGKDEGVFGIASNVTLTNKQHYSYVLIYNDPVTKGDHDYNDLVVGVNFTPAVPEPETYAMLIAGLGLMGTIARRRKSKQA